MHSFRFCETYLSHIKLFVGDQSAISLFLGRNKQTNKQMVWAKAYLW